MQNKVEKKLKVLRIIARLNIGGPAIHTILLTEGLNRDRFVSLLITGKADVTEGDMSYLAGERGVLPLFIPELGCALHWRNDFIAFWKVFCLIKRERPDIIHTHTAKAGTLGRLAALLYKVTYGLSRGIAQPKLVHTFHGHVLHSYFGKLKSRIFLGVEQFLAFFTDKIITVGENLKKELITLKVSSAEKIVTIPLGLELTKFLDIERGARNRERNYLSVGIIGRLVPVKNHRMFLDVVKKIVLDYPEEQMRFIIIGDGSMRRQIEDYARALQIRERVEFMGWRRDLENIYQELDVVALTSLNEGTPVCIIEALAAGVPVVAANVGAVADLLGEVCEEKEGFAVARRGILVKRADVEAFAKGIIYVRRNTGPAKLFAAQGREFVKSRYTREILLKNITSLYEQLVNT